MALSTPSPSASPRKETEAERIRLRKIELYNLLEELEKDNKECNEDIGRYGQKLFYCIRDIEKEFKRTEAPLSLESLRAYGVDIQSMVAKTDKKKKKFNPSWLNATGQSPKKKEKASTVQFSRKAEYAFRSDKNNNDADHEEYKIKDLLKTARSILNKITPATKDEFIEEFLALHVAGEPPEFNAPEGQLAQVMDIVFAKATSEPLYCPLYAELCKRQFDADIRLAGRSPFASAAVEKLQKTLQNKSVDIGKNTIDKETNVEKKENTILQNHEEFRKYKLGSINFVEQLYNKYVVRTILIRWCLFSLLRHTHPDAEGNFPEPPYDEEFIFCATRLIEAVGRKFTNCTDFDGAAEYLDQTINHLLKIAPNCSPKIRFKILDMKELSDNNWEQRKIIVSGIPKSIDEIHKETEPSGTLRAWRRFSIPKNRDSVPRPPRNDVLETFVNLRKRYSHAAGCGKYCTTSCPRILKIQELQIGQRTLLNVPERYWLYFQILNYLHGFCSIFLFVVGSICFCLGVQHSQYYTKVNCGDGAGLWPPIVNMIAAVAGQYAMRIIVYWPSFIHLILLVIAIPFTLLLLIDSAVAVPWWLQQPIITLPQTNEEEMTTTAVMSIINNLPTIRPKVVPTPVNIPQWKDAFAEMDLFLSVFAGVNLVLILCIMVFYIRWWFPIHIQRDNDQELR